jgi:hypothetical protein
MPGNGISVFEKKQIGKTLLCFSEIFMFLLPKWGEEYVLINFLCG